MKKHNKTRHDNPASRSVSALYFIFNLNPVIVVRPRW